MSRLRGRQRCGLIGYGMGGSLFHAPFIAENSAPASGGSDHRQCRRQAEVRARYPAQPCTGTSSASLRTSKTWTRGAGPRRTPRTYAVAEAVLAQRAGRGRRQARRSHPGQDTSPGRARKDMRHVGGAVPEFGIGRGLRTRGRALSDPGSGNLGKFESRYER